MDTAVLHEAIRVCVRQINANLEEASRVARAAEACILAGSVAEGVEVSMDIEQLLYEAGRLHDAVCLDELLSQRLNGFSVALAPPGAGLVSVAAHDAVAENRRARWPKPNPNQNRKGSGEGGVPKPPSCWRRSRRRRNRHYGATAERVVVQTGHRSRPASAAQGRDDRRHHEGDRIGSSTRCAASLPAS